MDTPVITQKKRLLELSSLALHILAMLFMLCDHLWATVIPGNEWLTWIGRLAYPIFAFCIAEGYFYTKNFKKYLLRLLIFALVTEIPFNLVTGGGAFYPFHQNVLWTFLLSLLCLKSIDKIRQKQKKRWLAILFMALTVLGFYFAGFVLFVDYYGYGILTVVMFYLLRGERWYHKLLQFAGLFIINCVMIKGQFIPISLFSWELELHVQSFAILSYPLILLYHGKKGPKNKIIQYLCYAFYPAHLLILWLIGLFLT